MGNIKNHAKIGLQNEEDIVRYLNLKTFSSLNRKWKKHIRIMFPFVSGTDLISSERFYDHQAKPDITIKIRNSTQYVSIKSGKNPSIHQEFFFSFARFLEDIGVDKKTIKIIYFYHFGETKKLNNNGKPLTKEELEEKYSHYFLLANESLDKRKIIEKVVNRTVIQGADNSRQPLTYFYYGSVKEGILLSKKDIYNLVLSYRSHENRPIHFGALNYQPSGRKRDASDYKYVRIKWPMLSILYYKEQDKSLFKKIHKQSKAWLKENWQLAAFGLVAFAVFIFIFSIIVLELKLQ